MIIDAHGHLTLPPALHIWRSYLFAHRGSHGRFSPTPRVSDDEMIRVLTSHQPPFEAMSHLEHLDSLGTDFQLISPRPFMSMHSERPGTIVHWFTEEVNNMIAQQCRLFPHKFAGVCGLPLVWGAPMTEVLPELTRCVAELGMVGAMVNPDPSEGLGTVDLPPMHDEYWYPLYEKLVDLDVPAYIHSAACRARRNDHILGFVLEESIAIINLLDPTSNVFKDFPTLKVVVSHGGGAIPYQIGRFQSIHDRRGPEPFRDALRRLWFDTCMYSKDGLECLIKVVGADRCLFGTENPGVGTHVDKSTGRRYDDIKPMIEEMAFVSEADRKLIFEDNARMLFKLDIPEKAAA